MQKPLKGIILSQHPTQPERIGHEAGIGLNDIAKFERIRARLKGANVASEILNKKMVSMRDGKSAVIEQPLIIQITGSENIASFTKKGGMYFDPTALKNVNFRRLPATDIIETEANGELIGTLNKQGIAYSEDDGRVRISDPLGLCVAAMSGARFTGSGEFLEKHGFTRRPS